MKEIRYNGGMLVFQLPDSWTERQFKDGGAAYYEADGAAGVLNVSLTTVQKAGIITEADVREVANTGRESADSEAVRLENGNFLRRFKRRNPEQDPEWQTFWLVANGVPPKTVRFAAVNFGASSSEAGLPTYENRLLMLDNEIRKVEFTKLTPEEIAALRQQSRPWWQFW